MRRRISILSTTLADRIPLESTVLDVGSGNGQLSYAILQRRPDLKISGIDTFKWPEQSIPTSTFDGQLIPFTDNYFDYCLVSDVLHHCEDPRELLQEIVRVSSKGIVIKDHVSENGLDWLILSFMDWVGNRGHGVKLVYNYWSWDQWLAAFQELGLEISSTTKNLGLYPRPFSIIFDRKLHFISLLQLASPSTQKAEGQYSLQ